MRQIGFILLYLFISCIVLGQTSDKKIYIAPFQVISDDEESDESIADEVRDYMAESLVSSYSLISDDEVRVFLNNAEMNQLMGGKHDNIEKIASAIKTDYMIYGKIYVDSSIRIDATLLHDGSIVNMGEITYSKPEYTDRAARALGKWLIIDREKVGGFLGKKDPRVEFKEEIEKLEKNMSKIEADYTRGSESIDSAARWRDISLSNSPIMRIGGSGFGMFNSFNDYTKELYDPSFLIMCDIFPIRSKDTVGDGVDIYVRGTYRRFTISEWGLQNAETSTTEYENNIGYFMSTPGKNSYIDIYSGDIGVRFVGSYYLLRSAISLYLNVASRFNYALRDQKTSDVDKVKFTKWGVVGGTGIEISLIPYIGLFTEFNIGYVPMGEDKINFEGPQVIAGFTFRINHAEEKYW